MVDPISDPIPADVSEAFDRAVSELIAWDGGGDEPSVSISGRRGPISAIAGLAGLYIRCPRAYSGAWSITPTDLVNGKRRRKH